jgi:hypothetical protein
MKSKVAHLITLLALSGCAASAQQPLTSCELRTAQVCSSAVQTELSEGTITLDDGPFAHGAQVIPLVVPVFRKDGVLAAEADCYANTDGHTFSLVRSQLAIGPSSEGSVQFLRERNLCSDQVQNQAASVSAPLLASQ